MLVRYRAALRPELFLGFIPCDPPAKSGIRYRAGPKLPSEKNQNRLIFEIVFSGKGGKDKIFFQKI